MQEKLRTGAIQVRKVRGDVDPADLFTKHLPSSIQIAQLVKLFGCDYREGRSTAALLLRPQVSTEGEAGLNRMIWMCCRTCSDCVSSRGYSRLWWR